MPKVGGKSNGHVSKWVFGPVRKRLGSKPPPQTASVLNIPSQQTWNLLEGTSGDIPNSMRCSWNPRGTLPQTTLTTPQTSQNLVEPGGTLVEPLWNLISGPPQTTPEPIWAETPKLSAVGKKKQTTNQPTNQPTSQRKQASRDEPSSQPTNKRAKQAKQHKNKNKNKNKKPSFHGGVGG